MQNTTRNNAAPYEEEIIDIKKQSLYARLKRLFSTDVIVRNVGGKQLKIEDTDNVMYATDRNSMRGWTNRVRSTAYNAYTRDFSLSYQAARMDLFRDYDTMDMDPLICSALDIVSDECLTYNELGKILTIHSENNNVKQTLENLFYEILNIEFNLWSWTRNMLKYGDFYLRLHISPEYGVYMAEPISAYDVERIENSDQFNKSYVKFQVRPSDTSQAETLEKYEMAHFRMITDSNFLPYGKSLIEGGRRIWKQLSLLEDAMLIHRIVRAPEKRIYYTDVAGIAPSEVDTFMEKIISKIKKIPYMDEKTGEYNLRYNLNNMLEDIYIPVRGGDSGTKIDTLAGMTWTGTEDVDYIRNKLMAALKIPKAFLGYGEDSGGKANLASMDVTFAKTVQRIQRTICSELRKIAIVHLYSQGYRDDSLVDFKLELTNPSTIFEREKIEIWNEKVDLATNMSENKFFPRDWIYKNIFKLPDDEIQTIKEQIVEDAKQNYRFSVIENDGDDPSNPFKKIGAGGKGESEGDGEGGVGGGGGGGLGGGGGGLGGGLGGLSDIGGGGEELKGNEDEESPEANAAPDETDTETPDKKQKVGGPEDLVKEEVIERDQSGEHLASDHPFGEDPLGSKENVSKEKKHSEGKPKSAIRHNYEGGTPLKLTESNLDIVGGLSEFLKKSRQKINSELLTETKKTSILDEKNIISM